MAQFDELARMAKRMAETTDGLGRQIEQLTAGPRAMQQMIESIVIAHRARQQEIDDMVEPLRRFEAQIAAMTPKIEVPDFPSTEITSRVLEWEPPEIGPSPVYDRIEELEAEVKELEQRVADLEGPPPPEGPVDPGPNTGLYL